MTQPNENAFISNAYYTMANILYTHTRFIDIVRNSNKTKKKLNLPVFWTYLQYAIPETFLFSDESARKFASDPNMSTTVSQSKPTRARFSSQDKKKKKKQLREDLVLWFFEKKKERCEVYLRSSDQNKIITLPIKPDPPVIKIVLSLYNFCIGVNCSELAISIDYLKWKWKIHEIQIITHHKFRFSLC